MPCIEHVVVWIIKMNKKYFMSLIADHFLVKLCLINQLFFGMYFDICNWAFTSYFYGWCDVILRHQFQINRRVMLFLISILDTLLWFIKFYLCCLVMFLVTQVNGKTVAHFDRKCCYIHQNSLLQFAIDIVCPAWFRWAICLSYLSIQKQSCLPMYLATRLSTLSIQIFISGIDSINKHKGIGYTDCS